mgnify:CR=1 FL=1
MTKVKICGITHEVEIGIMNELNPDFVGFVFATKSRHFIAPEHAGLLRSKLKRGIKTVGVFTNASLRNVALTMETAGLDMVQLHGDETAEYIAALREYTRCQRCGRPHAVLSKYGICRICFRELAYKGQIPGFKKSSW